MIWIVAGEDEVGRAALAVVLSTEHPLAVVLSTEHPADVSGSVDVLDECPSGVDEQVA